MEKADADEVRAVIPQIETAVSMSTNAEGAVGYVKEGYAFSPMFTLGYNSKIKDKEVVATWLQAGKGKLNYRCPSLLHERYRYGYVL